jgi:ABC-type antimicrobial peptide transport system permease subunit
MEPMTDVIAGSLGQPRFYLSLLSVFAGIALVLALAGLYGVMSYVVAQRTRELGIRIALGSSPGQTIGLVTKQGARLIGSGLAIGLVAGVAATRVLQSLLYGVSPLDVVVWGAAVALFALTGVSAALLPAIRATRVNPITAIRVE